MSRKTNIFAIYAWEDKNVLLQLRQSLNTLVANGAITIWADDPILPGKSWKPKVESHMDFADIFLMLVSSDFMKSKFIQQLEFKNVIDKYKANDATVIPVLVDDCQWQIDFKSDDYDFNLNELDVLPDKKRPIENWDVPEKAFNEVGNALKKVIADIRGESNETTIVKNKIEQVKKVEDQLELSFFDEVDTNEDSLVAQKHDAKAERLLEEAAAKKRAAAEQEKAAKIEQERIEAVRAAERKAEEAKEKLEREQKILEAEKEAQLRAEQERLLQEEKEAQRKAVEEQLREEEQRLAKLKAEEDQRLLLEEEAQREAEEEQRLLEQEEANEAYQNLTEEYEEVIDKDEQEESSLFNKKSLLVLIGVLFVAAGFYIFYDSDGDTDKTDPVMPETNTTKINDVITTEEAEVSTEDETIVVVPEETIQEESVVETPVENVPSKGNSNFSDLEIGDSYAGGIVFNIDKSNKAALVAHTKDAGPMSWKSAMQINEQLGDGWRLPTQIELKMMYNTIGKGGNNSGDFAEELYWSSTLYQKIQSRMVRFSDGNMSFHYSNVRESRKFLVRAVKRINE
ncbi:TIR domain-containing protein [Kriegella sp. EG-1]|nr:TIR domain-containing protein [Flavobacteriaceae bacterium EG-1]